MITPSPIFARSNRESPYLVSFLQTGLVAQLDRASDYGSEGWGFESSPGHKF